ncbi:MAG: hypothetical protein HFH24_02140 [Ruminococcus sp.]|nr:hypothetical protein [Ruminococcus sp.]
MGTEQEKIRKQREAGEKNQQTGGSNRQTEARVSQSAEETKAAPLQDSEEAVKEMLSSAETDAISPIQNEDAGGGTQQTLSGTEGNTAEGMLTENEQNAVKGTPVESGQSAVEGTLTKKEGDAADEMLTKKGKDASGRTEEEKEGEAIDQIKDSLYRLAKNTRDGGKNGKEGTKEPVEDLHFDTLPLRWEEEHQAEIQGDEGIQALREKIGKRREGSLYQAVIVSRLLKENKSNPLAASAFSRAVNSSAWGTASDLNAGAAAFTGLLSTFDKNATSQTVYQSMSLITNFITIVASVRNFYMKFRKLQWKNTPSAWLNNALQLIGMFGDFAMIFAKAVAIAKTISTFAGKDLPVLKKISNWMFLATGTSQAIALLNTSIALTKGWKGIRRLEAGEEKAWEGASVVITDVLGETVSPAAGTEEKAGQEAAGEINESQEKTGEGTDSQQEKGTAEEKNEKQDDSRTSSNGVKQKKKFASGEDGKRRELAQRALDKLNEEGGAQQTKETEAKKDILIRYLGLSKRVEKQKHDEVTLLATAVNCAVGIGTSLVTGGKFVTAQGAARTRKDDWNTANQVMGYTSLGMGLVANGTTLATSAIKIGSRATSRRDQRSDAVKQRLLGKIDTLGQEEYGLKYLETAMVNAYTGPEPSDENIRKKAEEQRKEVKKEAEQAEAEYQAAQELFDMMGVPTGQLVKAKNQEAFEKILISGLV